MHRETIGLCRAVALEQRGNWFLDREQAKCQVDQRVQFLNLRFECRNAILWVIGHGNCP